MNLVSARKNVIVYWLALAMNAACKDHDDAIVHQRNDNPPP
jgi:hypothetical protein